MTVREFLTDFNRTQGYGCGDMQLVEALTECGNVVWEGKDDAHRWYIIRPKVKEINGTFILFDDYIITGDGCMSDMGLEYDIDDAEIVEQKERVVTEVYYE
jgi:hypothetical protein